MNSFFVLPSILLMLTFNFCNASVKDNNLIIIQQSKTSNISSKRLWFNVTNDLFLKESTHLEIEWKNDTIFDESKTQKLETLENYNGGIYYYVDVPLRCESIRIVSKSDDNSIVTSTKWKTNLYPARLYEVFRGSDILRFRMANVFSPDACVLASFISSFYSCSSSYENGYSAYSDIEKYWLKSYAGNVKGTLETVYFYDYPLESNEKEKLSKTRLISVKEKLDELKSLSLNNPIKYRNSDFKVSLIGLAFFVLTLCISFLISFLLLNRIKNKDGAFYDFK